MAKKKKAKEEIFGNNILDILSEIHMSQQELADTVGTNASHISKIINNHNRCISLPIAMKIANVLDRPVEEVFILDNPENT